MATPALIEQVNDLVAQRQYYQAEQLLFPSLLTEEIEHLSKQQPQLINIIAEIFRGLEYEQKAVCISKWEATAENHINNLKIIFEFVEQTDYNLAEVLLRILYLQFPNEKQVLSELIAVLELKGKYKKAYWYLANRSPLLENDPLLSYLTIFNGVYAKEISNAQTEFESMQWPDGHEWPIMKNRLEGIFSRLTPNININHPSEWLWLTSGDYLIHSSSLKTIEIELIKQCSNFFRKLHNINPIEQFLYVSEEPNSQLLAQYFAEQLNIDAQPWTSEDSKGVIVLYDPLLLVSEYHNMMQTRYPQQLVFSLHISGTIESSFSPDIIGQIYKEYALAWEDFGFNIPDSIKTLNEKITALKDDASNDFANIQRFANQQRTMPHRHRMFRFFHEN